jgi:hypothetical protein
MRQDAPTPDSQRPRAVAAALYAVVLSVGAAAVDPGPPSYVPQPLPSAPAAAASEPAAATTLFGYNDMRDLLEPLVARFSAAHGGMRIGLDLPGTRFAPAELC